MIILIKPECWKCEKKTEVTLLKTINDRGRTDHITKGEDLHMITG